MEISAGSQEAAGLMSFGDLPVISWDTFLQNTSDAFQAIGIFSLRDAHPPCLIACGDVLWCVSWVQVWGRARSLQRVTPTGRSGPP